MVRRRFRQTKALTAVDEDDLTPLLTSLGEVEILLVDPTLNLPAPTSLRLLHISGDTITPWVYADPAAPLSL